MALLDQLLVNVDRINFLGGEPLILEQQLAILRRAVELNRASEIDISYNTNMTTLLRDQLQLWRQFRSVGLAVSIDAVGKANEYIRQNSRWQNIVDNITEVAGSVSNAQLTVHATFGMYNAMSLHELIDWSDSMPAFQGRLPWVNMVYSPAEQDARHLPRAAKQLVRQRISNRLQQRADDHNHAAWQGALNHMDADGSADMLASFWRKAAQLDQLKATDMAQALPELAELR